MSLFHKHQWEVIGSDFAEPRRPTKVWGDAMYARETQELFWGRTTVTLRCKDCGDIKTKSFVGRAKV